MMTRDAGAGPPAVGEPVRQTLRRVAAQLRNAEVHDKELMILLHDIARALELVADPDRAGLWRQIRVDCPPPRAVGIVDG
jgi:hypothetical protein